MSDFDVYKDKLKVILEKNNVCPSHGINHAIAVMNNATKCISNLNTTTINNIVYNLTKNEIKNILLAALLHDADDRKFFPNNKNYENLSLILKDENDEVINQVITMVNLVSSSKNGDRIPNYVIGKEWMLIPRYADRLEAIGIVGISRCFKYGKTTNNKLYCNNTPRCFTVEEIWNNASEERYNNYNGESQSMMDHYFDKLIRLTLFPIRNKFLDYESSKRRQPIIDFVLFFSIKKNMTEQDIEDFIANYKQSND